jgi:hypothetical protein
VLRRRACDKRLRRTFYDWAMASLIVQEFPFCGVPHGLVAQGRDEWRTVL